MALGLPARGHGRPLGQRRPNRGQPTKPFVVRVPEAVKLGVVDACLPRAGCTSSVQAAAKREAARVPAL
eukprot:2840272-Lingulodinium_polyedra.AAC.1